MNSNIESQLERFKSGFPFINLDRSAVLEDGILSFSESETESLITSYDKEKKDFRILKFVPASGAATRMFKELFAGVVELENEKSLNAAATIFINNLPNFVFYRALKELLSSSSEVLENPTEVANQLIILKTILYDNGLGFGSKPKGAIPFHEVNGNAETPVFNHILEGLSYAGSENKVQIHFTISNEHEKLFNDLVDRYLKEFPTVDFNIHFSNQLQETNTVAVNLDNQPILIEGEFLMRPSGHGALLENLNTLHADLVFIKNIDNVVKPELEPESSKYKKLLAGLLLEKKKTIFQLLNELDKGEIIAAMAFVKKEFGLNIIDIETLKLALNRPIRVCGMVKNTGEPGGGPFWVKDMEGNSTLQIVEKSQIDISDKKQLEILQNSTHFNPVDLVCWLTDFKGNAFELLKYRDDETGFITEKSFQGAPIKALELPGLWNGAMADWITYFIEVPLHTFNPVKTVLDLLKPNHSA
ncbi:MAG: DUF4301 family protein [Salibacteraceae bacterium]|nr:DUF4301 family protein [Salibacteraceae bacterium]